MNKEFNIIEVKEGVYVKKFNADSFSTSVVLTDDIEAAHRFDIYSYETNKIKKAVYGKIKVLEINYSAKDLI